VPACEFAISLVGTMLCESVQLDVKETARILSFYSLQLIPHSFNLGLIVAVMRQQHAGSARLSHLHLLPLQKPGNQQLSTWPILYASSSMICVMCPFFCLCMLVC
jgi:hypothetical protein